MKASTILANKNIANGACITQASKESRVEIAIAVAFAERESKGRHVYGHDTGGTFSTRGTSVSVDGVIYPTNSNITVTKDNYLKFFDLVMSGKKSNGVGIYQLTYAGAVGTNGTRSGGFLTQARDLGYDLSDPLDNSRFALKEIIFKYLKGSTSDRAILEAATRYNAGNWKGVPNPYGVGVLASVKRWRPILAGATL